MCGNQPLLACSVLHKGSMWLPCTRSRDLQTISALWPSAPSSHPGAGVSAALVAAVACWLGWAGAPELLRTVDAALARFPQDAGPLEAAGRKAAKRRAAAKRWGVAVKQARTGVGACAGASDSSAAVDLDGLDAEQARSLHLPDNRRACPARCATPFCARVAARSVAWRR